MPEVAFFFDLGGVLIENRGFEALKALGGVDVGSQEIRTRWLRSETVAAYERGQLATHTFTEQVIAEFNLPMTPEAFAGVFQSWVKDFYPGARDLVTRLRTRYRIGCLSNCNELHWRSEWDDLFDFPLASHLMGIVKPDPAAFLRMEQVCGLPLAQILYFDDSALNVEVARSLGAQAHLVNGFGDVDALIAQGRWLD